MRPQLAQPPKTDADKRVLESYVEVDIQYKYHPDEVTELMSEPDPELIVPPPADIELYNIDNDPLEKNNRASEEPGRASRMVGALEEWFDGVEAERRRIRPGGSILEIVD